jgi:hypothetical protein
MTLVFIIKRSTKNKGGTMLEKVTDRIYYLMNEEESEEPALGIVKGDQCCILIDAGNSKEHYL